MFKLKIAEKEVKNRIFDAVRESIDQYSSLIAGEVKQKTVFYCLWSLAGVLLLLFDLPKLVFYILSLCMILFVVYINRKFIQSLKKLLDFINHFDRQVKELVERKIKTIEDQSVKNKIGLWLSGQSGRDIEDFCISYFVRELFRRIKIYKWSLVIRIAAYTTAVFLFREIFLRLFI